MSVSKHKKKAVKAVPSSQPLQQDVPKVASFGYDEMLSELEAIVAEAATRLQDEENAA
ncbi:hypothetical protein QFI96_011415 [Raoultella sp. TW_WC1a-1]|uniref:Cytoplasmic protein n=1 Tax=Raoultella lignicola TaxID=3040939 RepID=A0ABU9F7D7_9ENTR|nr:MULTISPECIES: hypothetical protein [Enterobacteriaceae]